MEENKQIIEKVRIFVESECLKSTSHYGEEIYPCHFIPVVHYSKLLAQKLGADEEIVELAAWLHDIGSVMKGRKDHHISGAEIAETKLKEFNYPEEKIERVKKCILAHRGSQSIPRLTKEEQIVADADALSAFDNISGLFKAAIFHEGFNQVQARVEVRRKLLNSWQKLSADAKKLIEHKYLAAMILLGDELK
ncbi:MAG: HD domain-containing protein [Nanoarchaeota archaeon]